MNKLSKLSTEARLEATVVSDPSSPPLSIVPEHPKVIDRLLRHAPAALISTIVHLLVLICLAIFYIRSTTDAPLVVTIATSATQTQPTLESIIIETVEFDLETGMEQDFLVEIDFEAGMEQNFPVAMELGALDIISEISPSSSELEPFFNASLPGFSNRFSRTILDAQKHGIEIVIVFDSTGSMGGEIDVVKGRIEAIGNAVLRKIPRARFSLVTYRDQADEYVARGLVLNNRVPAVQKFLAGVSAEGGGDGPEAVQAGMAWALSQNNYHRYAQKVMLIFGDAPPHRQDLNECLRLATAFRNSGKASVSTITCRAESPMKEFSLIAQAGGGKAFVLGETCRLMEDLLVLAFGLEHREEVLSFFEIKDSPAKGRKPFRQRNRPER